MSKNLKKNIKMIAEVAIGDKRCLFFLANDYDQDFTWVEDQFFRSE